MPSAGSTDLLLRPAVAEDVASVAGLWLRSRRAAPMPPPAHPDEEVAAYLRDRVAAQSVWVAEEEGTLVGLLDLADGWVESLYVAPDRQRSGIGGALLDLAKSLAGDGFGLWVFTDNVPARSFYRAHGLVELEEMDGSGNEEGAPDVRMVWPGPEPIAHLRRLMDQVDHDLAAVVSRRLALTRAIQRFKQVPGHAGRDPDREAEIARRMAGLAPALDEAAWRRIMHEVITVSLDHAETPERGPSAH